MGDKPACADEYELKNIGVIVLPIPITMIKVLNYGMSACHRSKEIKSTAKHFPALQHQTEFDGMLLLTYLGDYLNVESPGYQIISEETVNCTE